MLKNLRYLVLASSFTGLILLLYTTKSDIYFFQLPTHHANYSDIGPILDPDCSPDNASQIVIIKGLLTEEAILQRASNCDDYFRRVPVDAIRLQETEESKKFRFAFSHLVHSDVAVLEMFLAVAFRPQNIHCIHVDKKSSDQIRQAVQSLVRCYNERFGNHTMFAIAHPLSVTWGHVSILQADLQCLQEIMKRDGGWDYFVNTAGTEMPVNPYSRFVEVAEEANGANLLQSDLLPNITDARGEWYYQMTRIGTKKYDLQIATTTYKKPPPPYNITVFLGNRNVVINRTFADFVINHPVAIDFYDWLEDTLIPEESFFATLVRIKEIRSDVVIQDYNMKTTNPRYNIWEYDDRECFGEWIRQTCNFGLYDLVGIRNQTAIVANKFNLDVDPLAAVCQWKYLRDMGDIRRDQVVP